MPRRYIRTCQACFHKQEAKPVETYKGDSWRDVKCKKCKSEALDYGSWCGYDTEPWRAAFKALSGHGLVMTDNELKELIVEMDDEGLFKDNELYKELEKRSKANAESIQSATISYRGY